MGAKIHLSRRADQSRDKTHNACRGAYSVRRAKASDPEEVCGAGTGLPQGSHSLRRANFMRLTPHAPVGTIDWLRRVAAADCSKLFAKFVCAAAASRTQPWRFTSRKGHCASMDTFANSHINKNHSRICPLWDKRLKRRLVRGEVSTDHYSLASLETDFYLGYLVGWCIFKG